MILTGGDTEGFKESLPQFGRCQAREIGPDCYHYIVAGRDCLPVLTGQLDEAAAQLIAFNGFVGDFLRYDDDQTRVAQTVRSRLGL